MTRRSHNQKTRVLLANPAYTASPPSASSTLETDVAPPSSLLSIAAMLPDCEFETSVIDLNLQLATGKLSWGDDFIERAAGLLAERRPDIVGFTAFGSDYPIVQQICAALKRRHDCVVVLGGAQASAVPEATLRHREFDFVVVGEGEETFLELCRAIAVDGDYASVPGLAYRLEDGAPRRTQARQLLDLDTLPLPAIHLVDLDEYRATNDFRFCYDIGRGCPFACSFCSTSLTFGRTFRMKSPARIVEELTWLIETHGLDRFLFTHDLFTTNRKVVLQICDAIIAAGIKPRWKCFSRCDTLDPPLLERMKQAGCESLFFGVESGSARVQKALNKNLDLNEDLAIVKTAAREIKSVAVGMIAGSPAETAEDLESSMRTSLHLKLNWIQRAGLNSLVPLSGTQIARENMADLIMPWSRQEYPDFLHATYDVIAADPDIHTFFYYIPQTSRSFAESQFELFAFNEMILRYFPYTVALLTSAPSMTITALIASWRNQGCDHTDPSRFHEFLLGHDGEHGAVRDMTMFDLALNSARSKRGTHVVCDFAIDIDHVAEALRNSQTVEPRHEKVTLDFHAPPKTNVVDIARVAA